MDPVLTTLGGLGLFLFGMSAMTSGLKKLAGEKLHAYLSQATRNPVSGACTGALVTAIVQSSSATTVAAVGFVSAGLMSFAQTLGILFGANIGTTITGWVVALVGFKLKLGTAALPLLFVSSLLYLAKKRPRLRGIGKALAGFSLVFLGIDFLQSGISEARALIDLSALSIGPLGGRLALAMAGIVLTLITQSSSATVAATLTALNTGMIDLPQAMAAIIGADVGTTATALMATIGGNTASRRTGFAHFVYNILTGSGAFLIAPLYVAGADWIVPESVQSSPEIVAVSFHTFFNVIGVFAILPMTKGFAKLIERLIPDTDARLTSALEKRLLSDPEAATDALESSVRLLADTTLRWSASALSNGRIPIPSASLEEALAGAAEARAFAARVGQVRDDRELNSNRLFNTLHFIDHLERLASRVLEEDIPRKRHPRQDLLNLADDVADEIAKLAKTIVSRQPIDNLEWLKAATRDLENDKSKIRSELISTAVQGKLSGEELDIALDVARWIRRQVHHSWRIAHYGSKLG